MLAVAKLKVVLATAPTQVAIDCTVLMLGATALVLMLSDPPWVAVIPAGVAIALAEAKDRLGDQAPQLSRVYRATVRAIALLLLVTLVVGLWVHALTEDWPTAFSALAPTLLLVVLVLAHTPWAHWLDLLGGDDEKADRSES